MKAGSREEEKPRPVDSYCIGAVDAFVRSYVGRVKGWFKRKMTHDKTVHWHFAANSSPVDKPFLLSINFKFVNQSIFYWPAE